MLKLVLLPILLLLLVIPGCGAEGDPIFPVYSDDVLPGTASTYNIGSQTLPYSEGWFDEGHIEDLTVTDNAVINAPLTLSDQLALTGDGLAWIELRPDLDFETVRANGKPTWVTQGVYGGFSLPIYAADNEELYLDVCTPNRWDEASNIYIHMDCWVDTAQDAANDAFNLQVAWESYTPGTDIIPATSNLLSAEITTGACAQFQSFQIDLIIPFVGISGDDEISFRIRRIAVVAGNEMDGEVVINHTGVIFRCDKLGNETP